MLFAQNARKDFFKEQVSSIIVSGIKRKRYHNIKICEEVKNAIASKKPVVALESTIVTHGMPYPQNIKTALNVEEILRNHGVVPATIGVINGQLKVGLSQDEIEFLSDPKTEVIKTSRRDLSYVMSQKYHGGTTVSATMLAANKAGISLFVTGGIGGVHRNASQSFDISADLVELGKTPVAVICAGVKSILDIGLTLEYLETQGVSVIAYSKSKVFPAFFSPDSKFKAPHNIDNVSDIAKCIAMQESLELKSGMVIGVPIATSSGNVIEVAIQEALDEARENGIVGKEITPFVLSQVNKITDGQSLQANIDLIENNANVGAQIAVELSKLRREVIETKHFDKIGGFEAAMKGRSSSKDKNTSFTKPIFEKQVQDSATKQPVIIGGSVFDIKAIASTVDVVVEATNPGKLHINFGGVGRNIAECLARFDCNPLLISAVGQDKMGDMISEDILKLNMETKGLIKSSEFSTASYSMVANKAGDIIVSVGDMEIMETISPQVIIEKEHLLADASIIIIDANINDESIHRIIQLGDKYQIPVWFEPTCVTKATKPFTKDCNLSYASPNLYEFEAMYKYFINSKRDSSIDWFSIPIEEVLETCLRYSEKIINAVDNLIITMGCHGLLHVKKDGYSTTSFHYPAPFVPTKNILSVSGAGDSLVGGMVYGVINGFSMENSIKCGMKAAYHSLHTLDTISKDICVENFREESIRTWKPI